MFGKKKFNIQEISPIFIKDINGRSHIIHPHNIEYGFNLGEDFVLRFISGTTFKTKGDIETFWKKYITKESE